MNPPPKVLLTYGWCRTAYVAAENLAKAGCRVYVCDSNALSMTRYSKYASGFSLVRDPFQEPEAFAKDVFSAAKNWDVQLILPVHEDGLILQKMKDLLPPGIHLACPTEAQFKIGLDKMAITQIAEKASVRVPRFYQPTNADEAVQFAECLGYPVVLKLRNGNSGKGVFILNSSAEVRQQFEKLCIKYSLSQGNSPYIQEFRQGDVYGACFLAKDGLLISCFMEHYIRCKEGTFGTSVYREPVEWPLLQEYAARLARELSWNGIGHLDFIGNPDRDEAYLIEMNPRFWGALNLAVQNGYNFPCALVSQTLALGNEAEWFQPTKKRCGSLWVVGEFISCLNRLKKGNLFAPFISMWRSLFASGGSRDDFRWNDPLPFVVEVLYYAREFLRSGGDTNPENESMMKQSD